MQPIRRDRHAELPIAVEQRIADFGINNVLTVGAVANKAIHLHDRPAERSIGELLSGQQTQQQNSGLWKALAEQREIGSDAIRREFR
jgi:hypothetical protein